MITYFLPRPLLNFIHYYLAENTTTTGILCQKAKWNSSGVTVATGEGIFSIFVDDNNNIYTAQADFYNQRVLKNSSD
ncbi:unnamed protein product, partial [Rotaria magnacalcarata]